MLSELSYNFFKIFHLYKPEKCYSVRHYSKELFNTFVVNNIWFGAVAAFSLIKLYINLFLSKGVNCRVKFVIVLHLYEFKDYIGSCGFNES